ncbi:MAG: ribosome biogenesis GTPase YlqF [Clostridia bacterium]|nr:ribosome biogenesis GTPase YlqF [Clostridia bacterium]
MHLQWFPGHMTRAIRMMEEEVKLVDGIIFVLDSRAPFACMNKRLEKVFSNKPVLYLLNKSDLVDQADLKKVIKIFESQNKRVITSVGVNEKSLKSIYNAIFDMLKPVLDRYKQKGVKKPLRAMVVGIPNTGKSTVINLLTGGKKARTGDKAGVTKDKQWVKVKDLELLDTPGTTPPSFDSQENAKFLAYIGSINDDILDFNELAIELIKYLTVNYENAIKTTYNIDVLDKTPLEILEEIGAKRGALKKGGEIDYDRVSKLLFTDLRKGKLGKILFIDNGND